MSLDDFEFTCGLPKFCCRCRSRIWSKTIRSGFYLRSAAKSTLHGTDVCPCSSKSFEGVHVLGAWKCLRKSATRTIWKGCGFLYMQCNFLDWMSKLLTLVCSFSLGNHHNQYDQITVPRLGSSMPCSFSTDSFTKLVVGERWKGHI